MSYLLFNIGCIECGVSSKIVGIFNTEKEALELSEELNKSHRWRESGQNSFEVFKIPEIGKIDEEYKKSTELK